MSDQQAEFTRIAQVGWEWRQRAERAERALQSVRDVFPRVVCPRCSAFEFEVEEANRIIDSALAASVRVVKTVEGYPPDLPKTSK